MNRTEPGLYRVGDTVQQLGESPLWCHREGVLYWVDLRAPALHRHDPASGRSTQWAMPQLIGGVALSASGGLVLALASGIFSFDAASGAIEPLVAVEPESSGNRLNDTKCDRRGRLWTGSMRDFGAASTGSLYRVGPTLAVERLLTPITIPNGLCWSPDDTTFYFSDTADGRIRAYDFDAVSGRPGAMRVLVEQGMLPGKPDGATVDSAGYLWGARYGGACVARIAPDGNLDRMVRLPVTQVTSCAFGDADLRTLFITTARQGASSTPPGMGSLDGALFALRVEVPGLPEPTFQVRPSSA